MPERWRESWKIDFGSKCVMCVWHNKNRTILPFSFCYTATKSQEQGPKNRRFRKCVDLHPQLTNITEKSSKWGPGGSTVSYIFQFFVFSGRQISQKRHQIGVPVDRPFRICQTFYVFFDIWCLFAPCSTPSRHQDSPQHWFVMKCSRICVRVAIVLMIWAGL